MKETEKSTPFSKLKSLQNSSIGGLSGLFVGIVLQPLEIIKMTLVINPKKSIEIEKSNIIKGVWLSCRMIYSDEGLKGFYRGLVASVYRNIAASAVYFSALDYFNQILIKMQYENNFSNFISSAFARILSGVLTNPIQVIRSRFEVIGFNEYSSVTDGFKQIYHIEGMKGFFAGTWATALRDGPFAGLYFMLYQGQKKYYQKLFPDLGLSSITMVSGLIAGVISTTLTNPMDILRSRLQYGIYNTDDNKKYNGVTDGFKKIYSTEGIWGFTKGVAPRLIRKPLTNSLAFVFYENFHQFVHKKDAF